MPKPRLLVEFGCRESHSRATVTLDDEMMANLYYELLQALASGFIEHTPEPYIMAIELYDSRGLKKREWKRV